MQDKCECDTTRMQKTDVHASQFQCKTVMNQNVKRVQTQISQKTCEMNGDTALFFEESSPNKETRSNCDGNPHCWWKGNLTLVCTFGGPTLTHFQMQQPKICCWGWLKHQPSLIAKSPDLVLMKMAFQVSIIHFKL